jgi:dUTP pyrophosphatase
MIKYFCPYELTRGTPMSSGYDLRAQFIGPERVLDIGTRVVIPTGLYLSSPFGVDAQVRPRSGLAAKDGVVAVGGTIDADYRGEIMVTLINHGGIAYWVKQGDRVAQLVFGTLAGYVSDLQSHLREPVRVASVEELGKTSRGNNGHGSTGR